MDNKLQIIQRIVDVTDENVLVQIENLLDDQEVDKNESLIPDWLREELLQQRADIQS